MNTKTDLKTDTSMYFDLVNFSELNEGWINEVIDNEFTEAEENTISLSMLFSHEAPNTLIKLADICSDWCDIRNEPAISSDPDVSNTEEDLWQILEDIDINIKHIQCLIYLLCHRALKKDASEEDMSVGLACGKLYFNILRLPSSGAYSVYHPNLFNLCIDCLPAPDFTSDKGELSSDFEQLSFVYVSTLFSLIPILRDFHLGNDSNTLQRAVKKLSDIAACEVHTRLDFNTNYIQNGEKKLRKQFNLTTIVSILAYEAFSAILSTNLNGDKDSNYMLILDQLIMHIVCFKARKNSSITQNFLTIKDNAVAFICHNLRTLDFCLEATQIAIKKMCVGIIDKNEFRNTVSAAIITILSNMNIEAREEMIDWFLLLTDSADTKDRTFALDIFGQILCKTHESDTNLLSESSKKDMIKVALIFAILTRCDDVSPPVRTRALTVLSLNMECILNFLDKTKDQENFETADVDDMVNEHDLDVNGNHRYFWYNMKSFRERLNEIAAILQRRIEDNNVTARKSALLALESLIMFDSTYVTKENLKHFDYATKDANIVVRKQVMQTLSVILEAYKNDVNIQAVWIKCILPLVHDPESTVQAKALSVLEEQFLNKIFSSEQPDWESAFILLKMIASDDFLTHQKYLQKAFGLWKTEKKLKPKSIIRLENYVGTEWEACVWFYVSYFSMHCTVPVKVANLVVDQFEKFDASREYPMLMKYITKIINQVLKDLSAEKSKVVCCVIRNSLESFSVPVELIPIYTEIFYKVYQPEDNEPSFPEVSSSLIKKCEDHLMEIKSTKFFTEPPCEELLAKYFCIIKEFCHFCPSHITPNVISILKTFSASTQPTKALARILSPGLRAHAFIALGKLCIQDEILAKDMLSIYAQELLSSKYDVIRSNVVVILIEMCKRYTSLADKYMPLISLCIKDKLYLIRYQTIVLLVNLLQEGYIKWRGPLFFCLLSSIVDEKETIQDLGRFSLLQLVAEKKGNLFSEHFIDSIFVFNFFPPPDNETVSQTVKDLERFSMPGEDRRDERMMLYTFLLESMAYKERAYLINSIRELLTNVAESVYPLDATTECILRDIFAILTCPEISSLNVDQLDNMDEAAETETFKAVIGMKRVVIIDPIIPAIVSLRNGITDPSSDIMHDLILFLKEFLCDFKDSLREILAIDKILLSQLELENKNDVEEEHLRKRTEKDKDKNRPVATAQVQNVPGTSQESQPREVSPMITEQDGVMVTGQKQDNPLPEQTPKKSPHGKPVRQHQKTSTKGSPSSSKTTNSQGSFTQSTFNIASECPVERAELKRLASTPTVVLTAVKLPLTASNISMSPIENLVEDMLIDESEESIP